MNALLKGGSRLALAVLVAVGVAGCGVKSSPTHPQGSTYPRQYPEPLPPVKAKPKPDETKLSPSPLTGPGGFYQYPNQPPAR